MSLSSSEYEAATFGSLSSKVCQSQIGDVDPPDVLAYVRA